MHQTGLLRPEQRISCWSAVVSYLRSADEHEPHRAPLILHHQLVERVLVLGHFTALDSEADDFLFFGQDPSFGFKDNLQVGNGTADRGEKGRRSQE